LYQGEATAEFAQGVCPVGTVEEEISILARGNDVGVLLYGFIRNLLAHTSKTGRIVGLVEDQARKLDDTQIVKNRDHGPLGGTLRGGEASTPRGYASPPKRLKRKSRITKPPKKKAAIRAMNPMMPINR